MAWLYRLLKPALFLIVGLALLGVGYAVVGYTVVPWLVRTQLVPKLGTALGGTASVQQVDFDPFHFNAALMGFSLKGAAGKELAGFQNLAVDLDLPRSVQRRRAILSARLAGLLLRMDRDKQGRWTPALPAGDGKGGLPFLLETFTLEGGRLELRDAFLGEPYSAVLDPLSLTLENLGPDPDCMARFRFAATGDRKESLAVEGTLSLSPLRSEGTFELANVEPGLWMERLIPGSPILVRAGVLKLAANYRFRGGEHPSLDIREMKGEGLELARRGVDEPGYRLTGLAMDGLAYGPGGSIRLETLSLAELAQGDRRVAGLTARGLAFDPGQQAGSLQSLAAGAGTAFGWTFTGLETGPATWTGAARDATLDRLTVTDAASALGGAKKIEAGGIVWSAEGQEVRLDRLALSEAKTSQGTAAKAEASGLVYGLASREIKADQLTLEKAASPRFSVASAKLNGLAGALDEPRIDVASVELAEATGSDASLGKLAAAGVAFRGGEQSLKLDSAKAETLALPWLKAASLAIGAASASLRDQSVWLDSATVRDAVALGPVEKDSQPPPPAAPPTSGLSFKPIRAGAGRVEPARYVPRAARVGTLELDDLKASLPEKKLSLHTLVAERAEVDVRMKPGHRIVVDGLPRLPEAAARPGPRSHRKEPGWQAKIGEIRLADSSSVFRDETVDPPVRLGFGPVALRLRDFGTSGSQLFKFRLDSGVGERGKLEVDGQARLEPISADLRFGVDQVWLKGLQSYWQQLTGVEVTRGRVSLWGDITVRNKGALDLDFAGGADIVEFDSVDRKRRDPYVRWNYLKLDGLVFSNQPQRLGIRTVTSEQAFARVVIGEDGSLNLIRDLLAGGGKPAAPAAIQSRKVSWPVVAGLLRIKDLKFDFTDLRLKPGFTAGIEGVSGTISGLSSNADATARVLLEGRLNQMVPVRIFGQINPFQFRNHTDVTLDFQGLNMTTLSGYSSKFAGYRIEKGKMDLTLRYRMQNGKLEVDNRVILDQLTLGEKVDNPGAPTLPIDLAIAVLKDADGRIDLDLPISGDLSNPSFSLASLYGEAIRQFFVKLVTAPYTLISNLAKDSTEDLGSIDFKPGEAKLSASAKGRLAEVAELLKLRPSLHLDVRGAADPRKDKLALADRALRAQLENDRRDELREKGTRVRSSAPIELSEEDYRRLFTRYYRLRHPTDGDDDVPLAGTGLDQAKQKVLAEWPVNEMELRGLANARSGSIREWLIKEGGLTDQRIYLLDVKLDATGDKPIKASLALTAS